MRSFFDAMTPWPRKEGALHVYALPDDDTRDTLAAISERLDGIEGLPRMPLPWLHLTITRYGQFDGIGSMPLQDLAEAIDQELVGVGPFDIELGAPTVSGNTVTCEAPSVPEWERLVSGVRRAVSVLGDDEELPPAPHGPHVTLAYANGDVDDALVTGRLADAPAVGTLRIDRVFLVSVTVRPELGSFDWMELANWSLKG